MNDNPSLRMVQDYIDKYGKRGAVTVNSLGKMAGFMEAMKSDIGQELLKDDIARMEELLDKVVGETINPQELAEYRYLKNTRIPKIVNRITQFTNKTQEIMGNQKTKEDTGNV